MNDWQPTPGVKIRHTNQCAWCARLIRGESFMVTFADKAQALFHIECLSRYREVMAPSASS